LIASSSGKAALNIRGSPGVAPYERQRIAGKKMRWLKIVLGVNIKPD